MPRMLTFIQSMELGICLRISIGCHDGWIGVQKSLQLSLCNLVLDQVHLAENVEVRYLKHDHGTHCRQGSGEELGLVYYECGFNEVGRAKTVV